MSEKNYQAFWNEALKQIHEEYKAKGQETEFTLWFNMEYVEDSISSITVNVPSDFMWTTMCTKGYVQAVETKIEQLCGRKVSVQYVLKNNAPAASSPKEEESTVPSEPAKTEEISESVPVHTESTPKEEEHKPASEKNHPLLREDYTFERFVMGENSEYAYSASLAAAKAPGKKFNPLLIYGGTGLGKTHLMQSIGNYIFNNPPEGKEDINICYISAENFTNEFTKSLRDQTTDQFKAKYRKLDVLLLDDIHFFENKISTQEELFYTFEALFQRKAQMVFTCDRPLSKLNDIEDRLRSRFSLGTPIDLQPPSYETRKAILLKKLELNHKTVSDDVIDFIAKSVQSNVRALEGCLNKLINYAELLDRPLTLDIAKKQLSDVVTNSADGSVTIDTIQKVVANHYNISLSDIKSEKRIKKLVIPRQIAIYLSSKLTNYSLTDIAQEFGGRDHTTIMHSRDKVEVSLKTDASLSSLIDMLTREIKEYKKP